MSEPLSPEGWAERYEELHPAYTLFVERLEGLIRTLLDDEEIPYARVFSWAESSDELTERIYRELRSGRSVDDPLDGRDVAGVSIVAYARDEVERIWSVVERELDVDHDASFSIAESLAANADARDPHEDRLGYAYPYVVVSLPPTRTALTEWRAFDGLRVKVEVQTLLHEIWEEYDRDELPYRRDTSYPKEVRQLLDAAVRRLAAADGTLARIWPELARSDERYDVAVAAGELELEVNARSVLAYLRGSGSVAELVAIAEAAGLVPDESLPSNWQLDQILLWLLAQRGMTTIAQLDRFVRESLGRAETIFRDVVRISTELGDPPYATRGTVLIVLLLILARADAETVALAYFRAEVGVALNTLIGNPIGEADAT